MSAFGAVAGAAALAGTERPPLEVADLVRRHGAAFLARQGAGLAPAGELAQVQRKPRVSGRDIQPGTRREQAVQRR